MDDDELRQVKRFCAFAGVFLISTWFAFGELRYLVFGRTTEAAIEDVKEGTRSTGRRFSRREVPVLRVTCSFAEEDGTPRRFTEALPIDWEVPGTPKVEVQYIAGNDLHARVVGQSNSGVLWVFFACLAIVGYQVYKLWAEAREAVSGRPAKRARR